MSKKNYERAATDLTDAMDFLYAIQAMCGGIYLSECHGHDGSSGPVCYTKLLSYIEKAINAYAERLDDEADYFKALAKEGDAHE